MYNCSWNTICSTERQFHTTLSNEAPKATFRGRDHIEIAAKMASCQFNYGIVSFGRPMQLLKIPAGSHSFSSFQSIDQRGIQVADVSAQEATKIKRAEQRRKRKGRLEKQRRVDGGRMCYASSWSALDNDKRSTWQL